jgi:hypothetical protein
VERGLLVDGSHVGRLALGGGKEVTLDVELEACEMKNVRSVLRIVDSQ